MAETTIPAPTSEAPKSSERNVRRSFIGRVISDKMTKTRRVEIPRQAPHPRYGKIIKRRTVCYVHDENNESRTGDEVEIMETRPLSKTKRYRLVRVVRKAPVKVLAADVLAATAAAAAAAAATQSAAGK
jgi:small subunit ribosomal protein S17